MAGPDAGADAGLGAVAGAPLMVMAVAGSFLALLTDSVRMIFRDVLWSQKSGTCDRSCHDQSSSVVSALASPAHLLSVVVLPIAREVLFKLH